MENKNLNIENQEAVETKAKSELNTQESETQSNLLAPTKQHRFNLNIWQDPKKRKLFGQIFYPIWIGLLIAGVIAIVCVRTSYGLTDQSDSITYIIAVIMGVLLVAGTIISAFYQKNEPIDDNINQNEDTPPSNQDATASQNAEEANLNIIENTEKTNSATSKNTNEINSNISPNTDETNLSTAENTNKIDSNNSQNAKK